jgi:RNA polymerase sigma factor (sigma-70 family)
MPIGCRSGLSRSRASRAFAFEPINSDPAGKFLKIFCRISQFGGALMGKNVSERTLLEQYVEKGSEQAFRELVARYVNLVYSSAIRLVGGDTHLAEDVVQTVFADLARLAGTISKEVMLGGWLHRRTCHVAGTMMRANRRRQHREKQAAEMNTLHEQPNASFTQIAPLLDEAIDQLSAPDRTAIVLRFFEQRDLRAVGDALGSNEDAAQKRVARALEKLRGLLVRRGVALSGAALATMLSAEAVTTAPAALVLTASSAALTSAAASGGLTLTILKFMAMTKLQIAVSAIAVASLGTALVIEHQAEEKLREEKAALVSQVEQLTSLRDENQRSTSAQGSNSLPNDQFSELLRLRGEVSGLRRQTNELAKLQAENRQLKAAGSQRSNSVADAPLIPKESWQFAGYADPESAFQSAMWAVNNANAETWLASLTPREKARFVERAAGRSVAEMINKDKEEIGRIKGFRIVGKNAISDDEVILEVFAEGLGETLRASLRRIDGQWKANGPVEVDDKGNVKSQ